MTVAQRWRRRRNLVIAAVYHTPGISQRLLADVFDLPRSRIQTILRDLRDERERLGILEGSTEWRTWHRSELAKTGQPFRSKGERRS